jgi:FkbM family methyltransferase
VIDVGANIGFYTLEIVNAVGPSGRVLAIEASPKLTKTIERHLKENNISNVTIVPFGVAESSGSAALTLPKNAHDGMLTLGKVEGTVEDQISLRTIDDIVEEQNVSSIDFIKMDIEGSELSALKGATKTIERVRPPILIELNEQALNGCGASTAEVKGLLHSMGYQGSIVGQIRLITSEQPHVCDECIFTYRG